MSLFRILDDVYSFMSTLDVFADSPQGGGGGDSQPTARMEGGRNKINHMTKPTGGGGGRRKPTPRGGGGFEPWNIYVYMGTCIQNTYIYAGYVCVCVCRSYYVPLS